MASVVSSNTMNTIHLGEIVRDDGVAANGWKYSDASLSDAELISSGVPNVDNSNNSNSSKEVLEETASLASTLDTHAGRSNNGSNGNRLAFVPVRSGGGSVYSRSSKVSVRRRDVIKPVAIALPPPPAAASTAAIVTADVIVDDDKNNAINDNNNEAALLALVPSKNDASQWAVPSNNNDELALVVHGQTTTRGMEPPETSKETFGCDPPECDDDDERNSNVVRSSYANRYRRVEWVDPKSVSNDSIDHHTLRKYRQLAGHDHHDESQDTNMFDYHQQQQQRVRIATVSSGYKTARFFVREDLDQRIYFHELEDAVSYMARRGYARMDKGMEKEWMGLLKRAHEVVKVGRTKKKQRYRKGKLVLIMYKPIKDETVDHYSDVPKEDESVTSARTAHTSLGRSIRCGYKSYSEKFIAEQNAASGMLLLTDGVDAPSSRNNKVASSSSSNGLLQITNGNANSSSNNMSILREEEGEEEGGSESTPASEKKRGVYGGGVRYFTPDKSYSEDGEESSDEEEEEEEEEDGSQESEEDKSASEDYLEVEGSDMGSFLSEDEDDTYNRPSSGVVSVDSTINSEMSSIVRNADNNGGGVYMAKNCGTAGTGNTLNKKRAPTPFDKSPGMVSISSESDSEA